MFKLTHPVGELCAAQNVHVEVLYALAGVLAAVGDEPKTAV